MKRILFNIQRVFNTSQEELDAIEKVMKTVHLDKNEYFLKDGEVCHTLAFIEKGSMRLYYESSEKEVCNDFFFENSVIGSFASFLSHSPSIVNIVAIENCELLVFDYDDVMTLIEQYPAFKKFSGIIMQEQLLRAERREAALLRNSPEERFKNLLEEHPKIFKRVPLRYIASYLAITPETLSRYRTRFLV